MERANFPIDLVNMLYRPVKARAMGLINRVTSLPSPPLNLSDGVELNHLWAVYISRRQEYWTAPEKAKVADVVHAYDPCLALIVHPHEIPNLRNMLRDKLHAVLVVV